MSGSSHAVAGIILLGLAPVVDLVAVESLAMLPFPAVRSRTRRNTRRRLTLIGQLRAAIANHEFTLVYQPKLNVATGRFSGVEALVRWLRPDLGLLDPDEFIPLAERSGLIKPLTEFVLEQAVRQATRWGKDGLTRRVAITLSARTFLDPDLPNTVAAILARAGLDPSWLELEITEIQLMSEPERGPRC